MSKSRLFVYGTLKRGERNHRLLAGEAFVRMGRTLPRYRLLANGSYPCLVRVTENGLSIEGEVWLVEEASFGRLDEYEGAPGLFRREWIELEGGPAGVQAYFYQDDVAGFRDCGAAWTG
jgi:gamma-glutamylaminecyclotransferase